MGGFDASMWGGGECVWDRSSVGEEAGGSGARLAAPGGGGTRGARGSFFKLSFPLQFACPLRFPLEGSRLCDARIVSVLEGSREGNLDGG